MSASLSQRLDESVTLPQRFIIAFGNTDEIFAVAMSNETSLKSTYMYGLILTPVIGWTLGTLAGAVAGNVLPQIFVSALGVAIYGMLTAVVVPQVKKRAAVRRFVRLFAVVLGCCFEYIPPLKRVPGGFSVIISAVAAAALLAVLMPVSGEEGSDAQS